MNDKESSLFDYEPSDGEDDHNEPSQAEPEKDLEARKVLSAAALAETGAERKERVHRSAEKVSAITGDPVHRRTPSPMGHQGPTRQSLDGSTQFRRIDASVVVADKIGPKLNPVKHNAGY